MIQVCVCQTAFDVTGCVRSRASFRPFDAVPRKGDTLFVDTDFPERYSYDVTCVQYSERGVAIVHIAPLSTGMSWDDADLAESRRRLARQPASRWLTYRVSDASDRFNPYAVPELVRGAASQSHLAEASVFPLGANGGPLATLVIGSDKWLESFMFGEFDAAQELARSKTPVQFVRTDETGEWCYAAVFEETDLWAAACPVTDQDGFETLSRLIRRWNDACGVTTPHITDITAAWLKKKGLLLTREMSLLDVGSEGLEYRSGPDWTDANRVGVAAVDDRWRVDVADPVSATLLTICEIAERQKLIRLLVMLGVSADLFADDL